MASPQPAYSESLPHIHPATQTCPVCDQPVTDEKAQEIQARFEARERELTAAANARAAQQLAQERAKIETAARNEGRKAVEAAAQEQIAAAENAARAREHAMQERLAAAEQARVQFEAATQERVAAAERDRQAAVTQFEALKASHDSEIQKVRGAMERDKTDALNAQNARHFQATQKLTGQLADLQRQLEKKTADELGEGAEINLYDALSEEFPEDQIERVRRGASGPDIIHDVRHNGAVCGRIIFESKDDKAWRSDYVTKLRRDQMTTKADHAILSVLRFPAETRQLHVEDGIIIANPARVIALVHVLRRHLIEVHGLRLSKNERAKKMAALYDFITSSRCAQFLDAVDRHADDLLELQEKEKRQHDATWKRQGILYRSIQKARADLAAEIDRIIGTVGPAD
jgi:hypothetical protein